MGFQVLPHRFLIHYIWLYGISIIGSKAMASGKQQKAITPPLPSEYTEESSYFDGKEFFLGAKSLHQSLWYKTNHLSILTFEELRQTIDSRNTPEQKKGTTWNRFISKALELSPKTKSHDYKEIKSSFERNAANAIWRYGFTSIWLKRMYSSWMSTLSTSKIMSNRS
uniref:AlNc14C141G7256 protein n=1 Tax=Albugo laibachii Nc14 TaxID=890382 RepID=F0WL68_9STRA|nr:AlNc14C141G7256 [Albugo laibachii Nc14]|eukprot:CCA22029.1 AlNc14C141G7256 [Albugo laibachii Nc14]